MTGRPDCVEPFSQNWEEALSALLSPNTAQQMLAQWGNSGRFPISPVPVPDLSSIDGEYHYAREGRMEELSLDAYRRRLGETLKGSAEGTLIISLSSQMSCLKNVREVFRGCRVGLNIFISSGGSSGIGQHYDDHHVFAFQLLGEKRWDLYGVAEISTPETPPRYSRIRNNPPTHSTTTSKGSCLYMKSGEVHRATTPNFSVHATVGIYPPTVAQVVRDCLEQKCQTDMTLRSELPLEECDEGALSPVAVVPLTGACARLGQLSLHDFTAVLRQKHDASRKQSPLEVDCEKLTQSLRDSGVDGVVSVYARGSAITHYEEAWDVDFIVIVADLDSDIRARAESIVTQLNAERSKLLDVDFLPMRSVIEDRRYLFDINLLRATGRLMYGRDLLSILGHRIPDSSEQKA